VRGGTDGHGRRCCGCGRAAAGWGSVALPGLPGGASRVGTCPGAGDPWCGRGGVAAPAAAVAVRGVRGDACAAAGELPAAAGGWGSGDLVGAGGERGGCGAPEDRGCAGAASVDGAQLAGPVHLARRAGPGCVHEVAVCAGRRSAAAGACGVGGSGRGGRSRRGGQGGGAPLARGGGQRVAGRAGQFGEPGAAAVAVVDAGSDQHQSGLGAGRRGRQGCGEQDQSPFCRVLEVADDRCR